jgi:hypothetical protein
MIMEAFEAGVGWTPNVRSASNRSMEAINDAVECVSRMAAGRYRGGGRVRGCPVGTIKNRLSYAKTRLKDVFAGAGVGAGEVL